MIKTSYKEKYRNVLINSIYKNCIQISESPYGNYAIQFLFDEWGIETCSKLVNFCIEKADIFSIQKYSSNIIDKLINYFSKERRNDLFSLLKQSLFNINQIKGVYNNKYGKFILIKVTNLMNSKEREEFKLSLLEREKEANIKDKKRIEIIMEILNKCDGNYTNSSNTKQSDF